MTPTDNPGFRITQGRGFQIKFANGWSISVQFGWGHYCDNQMSMPPKITPPAEPSMTTYQDHDRAIGEKGCADAEIAIVTPAGELLDVEEWGDSVLGRVKPDEVLKWMNFAAEQE